MVSREQDETAGVFLKITTGAVNYRSVKALRILRKRVSMRSFASIAVV
jgi:hypothetical protein